MQERRKADALVAWVAERKKTIPVTVNEDALRATIDMDNYAAVDSAATTEGGATP